MDIKRKGKAEQKKKKNEKSSGDRKLVKQQTRSVPWSRKDERSSHVFPLSSRFFAPIVALVVYSMTSGKVTKITEVESDASLQLTDRHLSSPSMSFDWLLNTRITLWSLWFASSSAMRVVTKKKGNEWRKRAADGK